MLANRPLPVDGNANIYVTGAWRKRIGVDDMCKKSRSRYHTFTIMSKLKNTQTSDDQAVRYAISMELKMQMREKTWRTRMKKKIFLRFLIRSPFQTVLVRSHSLVATYSFHIITPAMWLYFSSLTMPWAYLFVILFHLLSVLLSLCPIRFHLVSPLVLLHPLLSYLPYVSLYRALSIPCFFQFSPFHRCINGKRPRFDALC